MLSNVFKNIGLFIAGILLVRFISKNEYGLYVYANNILSYFMLVSGLGIVSAVFQICCENGDDSDKAIEIFSYGVKCGYIINVILAVLLLGYAFVFELEVESSRQYLLLMSFLPVTNICYEFLTIYYRSRLENTKYAIIIAIYTICSSLSLIIGAAVIGVWGIILSNYLSPLVCMVFAKIAYGYYDAKIVKIGNNIKKDIWKLALISMCTNAISNIMYMIDISMISTFIRDEAIIASYKIASTIPAALMFFPGTIIAFVYPYFSRHLNDILWTRKMAIRLYGIMIGVFGLLSLILVCYANWIVVFIFGEQYSDAITVFQILSVSLFFQGTFRSIASNLFVSQREVSFNLLESIITGIINIIGDYYFIERYQSEGVAIATLIVMFFSGILSTIYYFFIINKKSSSLEKTKST